MIESPLVIHLAQRPGPATGLPTRTEQGDLDFALYCRPRRVPPRHPRARLARRRPFLHAPRPSAWPTRPVAGDRPHRPVPARRVQDLPPCPLPEARPSHRIVRHRGRLPALRARPQTASRPAASPAGARGLCAWTATSTTPTATSPRIHGAHHHGRQAARKLRLLREDLALAPELHGPEEFRRLIVGWGSTGPAVIEALERVRPDSTSYLHCGQLYPLSPALRRVPRAGRADHRHRGQRHRPVRPPAARPRAAAPSRPSG